MRGITPKTAAVLCAGSLVRMVPFTMLAAQKDDPAI